MARRKLIAGQYVPVNEEKPASFSQGSFNPDTAPRAELVAFLRDNGQRPTILWRRDTLVRKVKEIVE